MNDRMSLLVLLALAPLAPAQETRPDPFATPPPMRRAARGQGAGDVAAVGTATGLEALAVRGLLLLRGRPATALLEARGQVHIVRAGDQLLDLSIVAIDASGVTVRTVDGTTAQVR
jgi:hypothetical protein